MLTPLSYTPNAVTIDSDCRFNARNHKDISAFNKSPIKHPEISRRLFFMLNYARDGCRHFVKNERAAKRMILLLTKWISLKTITML